MDFERIRTVNSQIQFDDSLRYADYSTEQLEHLCDDNDVDALYEMGKRYRNGTDDLEQDSAKALSYFEQVLYRRCDVQALNYVAKMYHNGELGESEKEKCLDCYKIGEQWGDGISIEQIGLLYENGEFVEQDINKAIEYYKRAITNGNIHANYNLGDALIKNGEYVEGIKYLREAGEYGLYYAWEDLGDLFFYGDKVEKDFNEAFLCYHNAYNSEDNEDSKPYLALQLGKMYFFANGVEGDVDKSHDYLVEALNGGMDDANFFLGLVYSLNGNYKSFTPDIDKALNYLDAAPDSYKPMSLSATGDIFRRTGKLDSARTMYETAAKLGFNEAEKKLIEINKVIERTELLNMDIEQLLEKYSNGDDQVLFPIASAYHFGQHGAEVNYEKALFYYNEIINNHFIGEDNALFAVADFYLNGLGGVSQNTEKAIEIYENLANKGSSNACAKLGEIYRRGFGNTTVNLDLAKEWYEKGVDLGNAICMTCLAEMCFTGQADGKQNMSKGISLLKKAISLQPDNISARWYMANFELVGVQENGQDIIEKNETHAIGEFEDLASKGDKQAIEKLNELYSTLDSKYYDIDKAIKNAEMALSLGYENAPQHLFAFHIFDEYRPQTEESIRTGIDYGMQCLRNPNPAVPFELIMSVMLDCYRKIGIDTPYSRNGYRQMFECIQKADIHYSDEKNFNLLRESIQELYSHLGYDENGEESFPRKELHDMAFRNEYIGKATEELRATYIGQYPKPDTEPDNKPDPAPSPVNPILLKLEQYKIYGIIALVGLIALFLIVSINKNKRSTTLSDTLTSIENDVDDEIPGNEVVDSTDEVDEEEMIETLTFVDVDGKPHDMEVNKNVASNPYNNACFSTTNGRYSYEDNQYSSKLGIDVSAHQGEINWDLVGQEGIDFVFIRLGYRGYGSKGTLNVDQQFEHNINEAKRIGLDVGIYFFSQATNESEAREEAQFVVENVRPYTLDLPIVFDTDHIDYDEARTDGVSGEQFTKNALVFCQYIEEEGYEPMIYSNLMWQAYEYDMNALSKYSFWYGDYEPNPQTPYMFKFWQYSNDRHVDGIDTDVDMDLWIVPKDQTTDSAEISDDKICEMARQYYNRHVGGNPTYVEIDSVEGDEVLIHLYDMVEPDEASGEPGHSATYDWYWIDRNTLKGRNILDEEIDLLE